MYSVQFGSCECARYEEYFPRDSLFPGKKKPRIFWVRKCPEKTRKTRKRQGARGATVSQKSCHNIRQFLRGFEIGLSLFSFHAFSTTLEPFPHPQCQMGAHYDGRDRPPPLSSTLPPLECQGRATLHWRKGGKIEKSPICLLKKDKCIPSWQPTFLLYCF